jgi:hypothetical protein
MSSWLLALVAAASVTTTCLLCVCQVRRDQVRRRVTADAIRKHALLRVQIAELREELQILRAEEALETDRGPGREGGSQAG